VTCPKKLTISSLLASKHKEVIFKMVSSRKQTTSCPVCSRADQVKKMQAAYTTGEIRFGPPPMPVSKANMTNYIIIGMILVGIGSFLTLVLLATNGFDFLPNNVAPVVSVLQAAVTILFILCALVLSFLAIRHIGRGDEEARQRYPLWDKAMSNWNHLRFCARNKVVFDPETNKVLSDAEVSSLVSLEEPQMQPAAHGRAAFSH
jgi:hypothetical protein